MADAVEDARAIRLKIDALAEAAAELLRDVRRSADRLTADLGFEPEVVSGVVQLAPGSQDEDAQGAPEPEAAPSALPDGTVAPDQDRQTSAVSAEEPAGVATEEDRSGGDADAVDAPVDATLVEDEPEATVAAAEPVEEQQPSSEPQDESKDSAGQKNGHGAGATAVKGKTVPCYDCQASGACSKCDGKGKRFLFRCSQCGGSGLCPTCGGPGFLWQ